MLRHLKATAKSVLLPLRKAQSLSPATQVAQVSLYHQYRKARKTGELPELNETGFRVFSQHEEDGMLLYIFALLGMKHRTFVDIGANDGVNSNCANLVVHFNWRGLFLDADKSAIERGVQFYRKHPDPWSYKPKFRHAFITAENINDLVSDAGLQGEIGLLSIDIDGNDYWVWKALNVVSPQVIIVEAHLEYGLRNIVTPYDADYSPPGQHPHYHGASPVAMISLGRKKGYRYVGCNHLGHNMIFVRHDLLNDELPEADVSGVFQHPSSRIGSKHWPVIQHLPFDQG